MSGEYPETGAGKTHTFTVQSVRTMRDTLYGSEANVWNLGVKIGM